MVSHVEYHVPFEWDVHKHQDHQHGQKHLGLSAKVRTVSTTSSWMALVAAVGMKKGPLCLFYQFPSQVSQIWRLKYNETLFSPCKQIPSGIDVAVQLSDFFELELNVTTIWTMWIYVDYMVYMVYMV